MARPKLPYTPTNVVIRASPKLAAYLDDIKAEEGHGNSRPAIAESLIWRGIEDLISKGIIDRRKGQPPPITAEANRGRRGR